MDIATIIGVILGATLVLMAILIGGSFASYLDAPSVLIVVGGATGATMAAFPLARFLKIPSVVMKTLFSKAADPMALINKLVELAEIARRDGILALENMTDEIEDEFLIRGIQMAVDGTDPEAIQVIMETELENLIERAVVTAGSEYLTEDDFPTELALGPIGDQLPFLKVPMRLEEGNKYLILKTLEKFNGNKTKAAEALGITTRTIRNKLAEYRVDEPNWQPS